MLRELKTALLETKADLERETDRRNRKSASAQQQVKMLTSRLAAVKQNSSSDLQAATGKAAKYKELFNQFDNQLGVAKTELEHLSKSYQGHLREHEQFEVELRRLRLDLADREAKVDRFRSQAWTENRSVSRPSTIAT